MLVAPFSLSANTLAPRAVATFPDARLLVLEQVVPQPLLELTTIRESGQRIVIGLLRDILQLLDVLERHRRDRCEHGKELGLDEGDLRFLVALDTYRAD